MRLCLPIADAPQGGMYSFYRHFRRYLQEAGLPFTERPDDQCDVLVANSWVLPYAAVLGAKRRYPRLRVLHRIDGAARDYGRDPAADRRQALVNTLADATVFQSAYGRFATREKFSVIAQDGPVIHNPVDVERFRPDGERVALPGRRRVVNVAFSTNPLKGAQALFGIARDSPDVDFVLVGRYQEPPALPNLHLVGYADWDALPTILRSCHVFLTLSRNEACPNVVLEALASGLSVLFDASGGTPELVGDCGVAVTPATFRDALASVLARRDDLARAARARAVERFAPAVVFPRYLETAASARRGALPGACARLSARLRWTLA